jgi:hypothetical protein
MAKKHGHLDSTSNVQAIAPTPASIAAGVEPEEMNPGMLIQVVLGVTIVVVVLVIVLFQLMNLEVQSVRSDMAQDVGRTALMEVELAAAEKLTQYAVIDAASGTYQIPIDRAIELITDETYQQPKDDYTKEVTLLPNK